MAKVYKRSYRDRNGKLKKSTKYSGYVVDEFGKRQRVTLFTNRQASESEVARLQNEANRRKAGLADPLEESAARPLNEHINDWEKYLRSKSRSKKHPDKIVSAVRKIVSGCGFRRLPDMDSNAVVAYLHARRQPVRVTRISLKQATTILSDCIEKPPSIGKLKRLNPPAPDEPVRRGFPARWEWSRIRPWLEDEFGVSLPMECPLPDEPGLSAQGSNDYLAALNNFGNWLSKKSKPRRWHQNPFCGIDRLNVDEDRRLERRAATVDETARFLAAARNGKPYRGLTGPDRELLYIVAIESGFRARELASVTEASLDLDSEYPTIQVQAGYSKRRRNDSQPIRTELAATLRDWLQERRRSQLEGDEPREGQSRRDEPLWPGTWSQKAAEMVRRDLSAAGIDFEDDQGRRIDFHSLRVTFATNLARAGVAPKTAQELMRHSDINLTMKTYTKLDAADKAAGLRNLPDFTAAASIASEGKADDLSGSLLAQNPDDNTNPMRAAEDNRHDSGHPDKSVKPLVLQSLEPKCRPLRAHEKSHRSDLNRGPTLYESVALPTEDEDSE